MATIPYPEAKDRFVTIQQIVKRAKRLGLENGDTITRAMEIDKCLRSYTKRIKSLVQMTDEEFLKEYENVLCECTEEKQPSKWAD